MNRIDNSYRYPCTRNIGMAGFGSYLEQQIGEPRRNIRLFAEELGAVLSDGKDNTPKQIVLTNSGSSANLVAALAVAEKLRRDDRPLTAAVSAFTFPTTISALILAGFKVSLIDVDQLGFNLSVDLLDSLPQSPSLVAITHFLGFPAAMDKLMEYKQKTGCIVIQDACETLVCRFDDKPIYTYGDIVTWSFYHPHHLSSYGGGAVYAKDLDDFILCDSIAHWGRACKCHVDESLCQLHSGPAHQFTYENIGVNVEISELNACFGRWQLQRWPQIEEKRKAHYNRLYSILNEHPRFHIWDFYNGEHDSPFVFPVFYPAMTVSEAWETMKDQGIEIRTLMGGSLSTQETYKPYLTGQIRCPNAELMSRHTFFVGCHDTLTSEDIEHIGSALSKI